MSENSEKSNVDVDGVVTSELDMPTAVGEGVLAQIFEPPLPTPKMILVSLNLEN